MICPKCQVSEVYENDAKVAQGWRGPIRKCKDPACGWIQWPPKPKVQTPGPAPKIERGPKWTWASLQSTYSKCLLIAEKQVIESSKRTKVGFTTADLLSSTACLFIAASRDGVAAQVHVPPPEPEMAADGTAEEYES